jgi:hypothetical protein
MDWKGGIVLETSGSGTDRTSLIQLWREKEKIEDRVISLLPPWGLMMKYEDMMMAAIEKGTYENENQVHQREKVRA